MTEPSRRVRTIDLEDPFAESFEGMCEVLLIRHGEQRFFENIPLGQALDAPLSDLGVRQAKAVGERFANARMGAVYASPMKRAHDTGKQIAMHHNLAVNIVDDLKEVDLWQRAPQDKGLLEIYTREELAAVYRDVTRTRKHSSFPYCEDVDAFKARVIGAVDSIIADNQGHRVAIACHGGVINAYLSHLLGSVFDHLVSVHHTSITVVRGADTRRTVLTINDYSHVMSFQHARGDMNA